MAHPLAGANVDRGIGVEITRKHLKKRASGCCHARLVRLLFVMILRPACIHSLEDQVCSKQYHRRRRALSILCRHQLFGES